jgi:hypothetical protein
MLTYADRRHMEIQEEARRLDMVLRESPVEFPFAGILTVMRHAPGKRLELATPSAIARGRDNGRHYEPPRPRKPRPPYPE